MVPSNLNALMGFNSKVAITTFELNFKKKLNLPQANLISF